MFAIKVQFNLSENCQTELSTFSKNFNNMLSELSSETVRGATAAGRYTVRSISVAVSRCLVYLYEHKFGGGVRVPNIVMLQYSLLRYITISEGARRGSRPRRGHWQRGAASHFGSRVSRLGLHASA